MTSLYKSFGLTLSYDFTRQRLNGDMVRLIKDPDDRLNFVSHRRGPNVLPNFALFTRLLHAAAKEEKVIIRDHITGVKATHAQLLTDAMHVRQELLKEADSETLHKLDSGQDVFVILLAPGGYEYVVAFLAIVAMGGVVVPIYPELPVKEMSYYVRKTNASLVLLGSACSQRGQDLSKFVVENVQASFRAVPIQPLIHQRALSPNDFTIDDCGFMDLNPPGLVIFSSGTTGPPKAAVRRRGYLADGSLALASELDITKHDVLLHCLPVHHATGICINVLPPLVQGACIEFKPGSFDPGWVWERFKQGGITVFSGVPTMYTRLRDHFEEHLARLHPDQLTPYVKGVQRLRDVWCGSAALPQPLQNWWTQLRRGRPILGRYGGTETALGMMMTPKFHRVPDSSVGPAALGVDVKLSNGNEGEILIRSPYMFSKYVGDPDATRAAHDADGYFKTGDMAEKRGNNFFILGRASIDIIKSGGYKISALDVERAVLGLPYIAEVMVVGVEDAEYGQRVAAAVVKRPDRDGNGNEQEITIAKLRSDLRDSLARYKIPTLLRVVPALAKSPTGKVSKKILGPMLFPPQTHPEVQVWKGRKKGEVSTAATGDIGKSRL